MKKPTQEPARLDRAAGVQEAHLESRREPPEVGMRSPQARLLLVASLSSALLTEVGKGQTP